MADDSNTNIPRPIGIKPITIKPMTPPATAPEATEPKAPTAPEAPAAPAAAAPKAPEVPKAPEAPQAATAKPVPAAPAAEGKPLGSVTTATVRLKPVMPTQSVTAVRPDAPTAPMKPVRPQTIQPPTIKPSVQPTPEAAAKAKTARILLDAALNEMPGGIGESGPPAPVGKITSRITSSIAADIMGKSQTSKLGQPQMPAAESGQPRTLRLKVPAASDPSAESDESLADAPTVKKKRPLVLKKDALEAAQSGQGPTITAEGDSGEPATISAFSAFQAMPAKKVNPVFPILAIAATLVIATLVVLYMSQACGLDRSLTNFVSFPGLPAPSWPGKVLSF
ncbi:MAG: hypothetical protein ACOX9C_03600 [Kiritimatiellia bacterium]|jgi:hypothetical protein